MGIGDGPSEIGVIGGMEKISLKWRGEVNWERVWFCFNLFTYDVCFAINSFLAEVSVI